MNSVICFVIKLHLYFKCVFVYLKTFTRKELNTPSQLNTNTLDDTSAVPGVVGKWKVIRIGLEVLGLEEVSELLERRLLVIVVLVNGDEAVADGALELDAVLRALGLLDDDPEELLDGRRGRRRGPRRRRRPGIARRPSCPSSSAGGPPARRCWPCQGRRRWRCTWSAGSGSRCPWCLQQVWQMTWLLVQSCRAEGRADRCLSCMHAYIHTYIPTYIHTYRWLGAREGCRRWSAPGTGCLPRWRSPPLSPQRIMQQLQGNWWSDRG